MTTLSQPLTLVQARSGTVLLNIITFFPGLTSMYLASASFPPQKNMTTHTTPNRFPLATHMLIKPSSHPLYAASRQASSWPPMSPTTGHLQSANPTSSHLLSSTDSRQKKKKKKQTKKQQQHKKQTSQVQEEPSTTR